MNRYDFVTALWLCERLQAIVSLDKGGEVGAASTRVLLATIYHRSGKPNSACTVLKGASDPESRFLYALCCYDLQKYHEAEKTLIGSASPMSLAAGTAPDEGAVPKGAAGFHLLGQICQRSSRRDQAIMHYRKAIELDSFLWASYQALCQLGDKVAPEGMFRPDHMPQGAPFVDPASRVPQAPFSAAPTPHTHTARTLQLPLQEQPAFTTPPPSAMSLVTPEGVKGTKHSRCPSSATPAVAGVPTTAKRVRRSGRLSFKTAGTTAKVDSGMSALRISDSRRTSDRTDRSSDRSSDREAAPRTRIKSSRRPATASNLHTPTQSTPSPPENHGVPTKKSKTDKSRCAPAPQKKRPSKSSLATGADLRTPLPKAPKTAKTTATRIIAATPATARGMQTPAEQTPRPHVAFTPAAGARNSSKFEEKGGEPGPARPAPIGVPAGSDQDQEIRADTCKTFRVLAAAYAMQCGFKCKEAAQLYQTLSRNHFSTGWVLAQMGRCYFEMVDYHKAIAMFKLSRKAGIQNTDGLELYSTALWHLKKEVELSYLAQQVLELDKLAPESWIVLGNCFSLQKEHETALKFFKRATQLDPWFAYAYTLSAHEFVANEDFDKAIQGYRHAIGLDERHYNAWYGMGNIYYRQEKYDLAAYHFKRALAINDRSSVLYCYLGMVLHANKSYHEALEKLNQADLLEPNNPLAKFHKANVYVSLEEYQLALLELEQVKQFAPKEASVHFLMGRIYKKLNMHDKAMMRYITALDLDPKDRNLVKAAIDKLHSPNDADEEEDF